MEVYLRNSLRMAHKRRQIRNHRANLLELRLNSKPFDLPDVRFVQLFRLDKVNVRLLKVKLVRFAVATHIPFEIQILATLHFYGYGTYQASIGSNNIFGLSQPSTSRAIEVVTNLINTHLVNEAIKFPSGALETAEIKKSFFLKFNMPNIIGFIDGTHTPIVAPPANDVEAPGHLYVNRKGYHSLNVLAITDANLKLIYADARFPGSVHDSAIWMVSPVRRFLRSKFTTVENQNSHILGDSGFPLEPCLLTPISNPPQQTPQSAFNKRFLSTRNSVERAFGVIKSRFRCLTRQRILHYAPEKAAKIVYCIFCLHNMNTIGLEHFLEDEPSAETEHYFTNEINENNRNHWHTAGSRVRDRYLININN